jgi:hypothetical protein
MVFSSFTYCKSKNERLISYLTEDSCKYWWEYKLGDSILVDLKNDYPTYWFCFDISGRWLVYRYNKYLNCLELIEEPPDVDSDHWILINKNQIRISFWNYSIVKLNKDTLILIEATSKQKLTYIRSKGKIPKRITSP